MFDSNEGKSGIGINKENQNNLVSYNSDEEFKIESELQSINMVELELEIKGKSSRKISTHASSNSYANIHTYANPSAFANPSTYANKIDHDSFYPILDMIVSRFVDVFEIDDELLNTLGELSNFESFHTKRKGKVYYHPHTYFEEEMEDIIGFSLLD